MKECCRVVPLVFASMLVACAITTAQLPDRPLSPPRHVALGSKSRPAGPSGPEVAWKATKVRFQNDRAVTGTKDGKKITFTAVDLASLDPDSLADGIVIGLLENEVRGDESDLP